MSLQDRIRPILKVLKVATICGGGVFAVTYYFREIKRNIGKVVNTNVLDAEKKITTEYIYIDDPSYDVVMEQERDKKNNNSVGFARIWKSLKHSLEWRLLWLCRHGSKEQRNLALDQLAAFKNNRNWDCLKIAQALDKNTAVLLARTRGVDLRYFLPPPIHIRRAALTQELLSYKFRDLILAVQNINPHSCIQHFLSKYFINLQDHVIEVDSIPAKPDNVSEKNLCILCLDILHHHIYLFNQKQYEKDLSISTLIKSGLLHKIAELILRYKNDTEIDCAVLRILTVLSTHSILLNDFFQSGLIGELARLLKSKDIRLSSSAAVCLANLSGEFSYRPGLFLLYPLYRTKSNHTCDTLLVHGLRGGVFVTWRQRDKKCDEPLGIIAVTVSDVDPLCEENNSKQNKNRYLDPELQQVIEDLKELEDEALLANLEVILHDIPIEAKREPVSMSKYIADKKLVALTQEDQDKCNYSQCWPKDWLPRDCHNIRILGFNYWSKLSEWLEGCPLLNADIESRAQELADALLDAGVGTKNIVWLAHSMGGLIVKQLLVDAAQSTEPTFKELCNKTKAVFFFSTPHRGSALATMHRAAAAILWPSQDVRQLQENSPLLLEIHKTFINFADMFSWETISFAEALPTLITAFKVPVHFVEASSADLGRGVYYQLPLDHLSICKPATRQSILYTTVLDVLRRATICDAELKYSESFLQRLWNLIWLFIRSKAKELKQSLDEAHNSDCHHSINQTLLDACTDGFVF